MAAASIGLRPRPSTASRSAPASRNSSRHSVWPSCQVSPQKLLQLRLKFKICCDPGSEVGRRLAIQRPGTGPEALVEEGGKGPGGARLRGHVDAAAAQHVHRLGIRLYPISPIPKGPAGGREEFRTPCAVRRAASSAWSPRRASMSGVVPHLSAAPASAPSSSRTPAASTLPCKASRPVTLHTLFIAQRRKKPAVWSAVRPFLLGMRAKRCLSSELSCLVSVRRTATFTASSLFSSNL